MAEKNLKARIVHKHDTEANWLLATNFIPMKGEIIVYDIDDNYSYERIKIGDGVQNVNDLPFADDALKNELKTEIGEISALVGDTAVSTQISEAIDAIPFGEKIIDISDQVVDRLFDFSAVEQGLYWSNVNILFKSDSHQSSESGLFQVLRFTDAIVSVYCLNSGRLFVVNNGVIAPSEKENLRTNNTYNTHLTTADKTVLGAINELDADISTLSALVGDTAVSEQIDTALSESAVLYSEAQTLTDEQKQQARENIGTIGYEWHELGNGYCFVANIPNKNSINNFESSVTTEKYPNTPALEVLASYVDFVASDPTKTYITDYYDEIISCITVLKESGDVVFPCNFLYTRDIHDINTYKFYFCNYISAIGMLILRDSSNTGMIQYQNGTIVTNTIFSDTTLTESARPADAKAVGDALALKADQTALDEVSALVGETAVSEQISSALENSGAVLYIEQELTDAQKTQARSNIMAVGHNFYSLGRADEACIANAEEKETNAIIDWDKTLSLKAVNNANSGLLDTLIIAISVVVRNAPSESMTATKLSRIENDIIPNVNKLFEEGAAIAASETNLGLIFIYGHPNDPKNWKKYGVSYFGLPELGIPLQWSISDLDNNYGVTYENGAIVSDTVKPTPTDRTLTYVNVPADGKAVGDALALKADKTALDEVSALVGETSVSEQISTALENSGAVLYTAQELTDEQKAQARANISKYDWHYGEACYSVFDVALVDDTIDWATLAAINDSTGYWEGTPAIYVLVGAAMQLANFINYCQYYMSSHISKEMDAIFSGLTIPNNILTVCAKDPIHEDVTYKFRFIKYSEESNSMSFDETPCGTTGIVIYNKTTETITSNTLKSTMVQTDFTSVGYPVESKAVGDALALKADKTSLDEISALIGESSVSDQIATALENSGAVLYTEQELTEEQKAQARANIGAKQFVVTITSTTTDGTTTYSADKTFEEIEAAIAEGRDVVACDGYRYYQLVQIQSNGLVLFNSLAYGGGHDGYIIYNGAVNSYAVRYENMQNKASIIDEDSTNSVYYPSTQAVVDYAASKTDLDTLSALVGDTSVSEQINTAINTARDYIVLNDISTGALYKVQIKDGNLISSPVENS